MIDQAIAALNTAVAQTAQDVLDADASATSAAQSASSAAQSAANAAESASGTEEYAIRAEAAQTAAESAQSAAQTAAQTATAKAIEAAQIVEGVEGYAESAAASASQAQTSAQTASTKASESSQSASTASTKATEATTAAGTATTAKDDAVSAKNAAQTAQAAAETAQEAAEDAAESVSGLASQIATNTADISDIKENLHNKAPVILETSSGSIASFSDGADNMPMKSLVVDIEPVQSGSGDPSPDNVRPISGWTGVTAQRTGENFFDKTTAVVGYIDDADGQLKGTQAGSAYRSTDFVSVVGGQSYYIKTEQTASAWGAWYDANKTFIAGRTNYINAVITAPTNAKYLRLTIASSNNGNLDTFGINSPSTDHSYHPYTGCSITIDWTSTAGTVYGGHIDVVSGELVAYPYYPSYNGETLTGHWISDRDVYAEGTTPTIGAQVVDMGGVGTIYHLSPTEIQSLYGQNHVWADTGDTSVEYRADTKLFIERLTKPDSADMIADANITSGQYFMVGNDLYKATANIANGGAIIVGTNCTRKSLSEALNEINS